MTRKERKRERRLKKFTQQLPEASKIFLKAVAQRMSTLSRPNIGLKFHCQTCHQSWEYAFDNKLVFCRECPFFECCLKDITNFQTCPVCKGGDP